MYTVYALVERAWVYQGGFQSASDALSCARWLQAQGVEVEIDEILGL